MFFKPFPKQTELSCAGCHIPAGTFNDQLRHDVGSGGLVKTPTLLNANFNAPYFHDGRYDTYEEVVGHFDRMFDLEFSTQDTQDLVAYLNAVGDGERAFRSSNEWYRVGGAICESSKIRSFRILAKLSLVPSYSSEE